MEKSTLEMYDKVFTGNWNYESIKENSKKIKNKNFRFYI